MNADGLWPANDQTITILAFACACFAIIAAIYYHTAEQRHARNAMLTIELDKQMAYLQGQYRLVELHKKALDQANGRIGFLVAHNIELEAENESLHQHNLRLCDLIRKTDSETIAGMAVMAKPQLWLQGNDINLN
jgi:hypothetical protein